MTKGNQEAWVRLLLERGYRRDQLILDEGGNRVSCSSDDLPAAAALVQNPHNIDLLTPAKLETLRARLLLGYLPHHLITNASGSLLYDREEVTTDCESIGFGKFS